MITAVIRAGVLPQATRRWLVTSGGHLVWTSLMLTWPPTGDRAKVSS